MGLPSPVARYTTETVCPLGSLEGSEYIPTRSIILIEMPVSSFASLFIASSVVSPSSTKPPGSAYPPLYGSFFLLISTSFLFKIITASTASFGVIGYILIKP